MQSLIFRVFPIAFSILLGDVDFANPYDKLGLESKKYFLERLWNANMIEYLNQGVNFNANQDEDE